MNLSVDLVIVIAFLTINLIVGLYHGIGVKTIKDHALGGRNFSTGAITATLVATWVSGSGFFITLSKTYSDGLPFIILSSSMALALLIIAFVFVPKMSNFMGITSIAEMMGNIYGKNVRVIIAIAGAIGAAGGIAVQFKVFGGLFDYFLGVGSTYSIFISATIIILYSSFGGIRAVTYTDILQFFTFGFVVPCIGGIIWSQLHSSGFNVLDGFHKPIFDYKKILNIENPDFWQMIPLMLYFAIPQMGQDTFQRISIGKNIQQVKKAFIIAAIIFVIVNLATAWIPFLIYNTNPNLNPDNLLIYIADTYSYNGLKGMILIGVLAMSMSTADSDMNAASVLFSNDFCKPLGIGVNRELLLLRSFSFALGGVAILLALSERDLLSIVLMANSFYMPIVTVPVMLTILGFRTTKKAVYIGMSTGFITVILWNIFDIQTDCIAFAMLVNLIFLLGSHYLLKQQGGWTKISDDYGDSIRLERKRKMAKALSHIKNFNFFEFCKKNSPTNELTYMGFGIYCIFYTFTTMYSTHVELLGNNGKIVLYIYQIMMITGVAMAMYPIWPLSIKQDIKERIVQTLWNVVIFYMLILFSGFFVMVSNFDQLQFAVFSINMVIAIVLIGWKIALSMSLIGFYCSVQFYKFYSGIETIDFSIGSPQFVFMYTLMLVGTAVIIFFKPQQKQHELTEQKAEHLGERINIQEQQVREALALRQEFICNISHEYHAPMVGISSMADVLANSYDKLTDKQRKEAIDIILKSSAKLEVFDANISSLSKLAKANYALNLKTIDFSDLVYERLELCRKFYEENKEDREFLLYIEEKVRITGDKYYLNQLLDNLIINAISYCQKGKIIIALKQTEAGLEFTISDEGIGIPTDELYKIFAEFIVSSKTYTIAGGRGVGLALCKRVIEVHGGTIKAESDGIKGARFIFTLPKKG